MTEPEIDPREGLTPLHRLLLDLGHFTSRYWELSDTVDPEQVESLQEDVGSIFEAFRECASAIDKIARQYLAEDGSVLPGPVVLVEVDSDGVVEADGYNYPVATVVIDWDEVANDGEYTAERKAEVALSELPEEVKRDLFDKLNNY